MNNFTKIIVFAIISILSFSISYNYLFWKNIAIHDLHYIHQIVKNNHPGYFDTENLQFKELLNTQLKNSLNLTKKINSFADYIYVLRFFTNGFKDSHFSISFDQNKLDLEWPGFIVIFQDNKFIVSYSKIPEIPKGSELVLCDCENPKDWMKNNIFKFIGNPDLEASWYIYTPRMSYWEGTYLIKKPISYSFLINNQIKKIVPKWNKISRTHLNNFIKEAKNLADNKFSLQEFISKKIWITLPSFEPSNNFEQEELEKIINDIKNYRDYHVIIFDLRNNCGGNSFYGTSIIKNLYSPEYYDYKINLAQIKNNIYVQWRASIGNREYLEKILQNLYKANYKNIEFSNYLAKIIEGIKNAISNNQLFFNEIQKQNLNLNKFENPVKAKVIVITNSYCVSACLDFLDEIFQMGPASHWGQDTNADSIYMEIRNIPLPSGFAELKIPIKLYRNRKRKSNEPYVPQIKFKSSMTTNEIKKFI